MKKWSQGVLDTLQDEIKCVADCCEKVAVRMPSKEHLMSHVQGHV